MVPAQSKNKATAPDFRLVLNRLEKALIQDPSSEQARRLLKQTDVVRGADEDTALKWARLAQMAGEIETALRVFEHIHASAPDNATAWIEHLELLDMLNRPRAMAKIVARARQFVPKERLDEPIGRLKRSRAHPGGDDLAGVAAPLADMRRKETHFKWFMKVFAGREDCFARQWADRQADRQGYAPVRRAMTIADLEDHFKGVKTYGIYLLRKDAHVKTAVIDADLDKKWRKRRLKAAEQRRIRQESDFMTARIKELTAPWGQRPLVEFSGAKGLHFWFFWDTAIPAGMAQTGLKRVCEALQSDLSVFRLEAFPKQAQLSHKGLGNLVKLPLGVHRLTGKRSFWIECAARTLESQLAFLHEIKPGDARKWMQGVQATPLAEVAPHPRMAQWAQAMPELLKLQTHCPPLGQLMEQCRRQKALSLREEKILLQTIGFLPRRKRLLHYLLACLPDYNPHAVDYKISRLRGTPLGCRRIHNLLHFTGDFCGFEKRGNYRHPLLHLDLEDDAPSPKAEKVENLAAALDCLKTAIGQVERFMP